MHQFLFVTVCYVILANTEGDRLSVVHTSSWIASRSTHCAFTNAECNNLPPVGLASKGERSHNRIPYSQDKYLRQRQHDDSCFLPRFQRSVELLAVESANEFSFHSSKATNNDFVQNDDRSESKLIIKSFIEEIGKSIRERTFVSISAKGMSKSDKKSKGPRNTTKEDLRGRIRLVTGRLIALKSKKEAEIQKVSLQVTFKYHLATDIVKNWDISTQHSTINEVQLGFESLFGISEDDTINHQNRNLIPKSEWDESDQEQPSLPDNGIKSATLELNDGRILELNVGKASSHWKKGSDGNTSKQTQSSNEIATHDRAKNVPLAMTESFWQALGVTMDENGKPTGAMSSKVRQCQKFVEIMDKLIEQRIAQQYNTRSGAIGENENTYPIISVVDMGCGRGYLTFGLHSFLYNKYLEQVQSRGIDVRPKLVKEINSIARRLGGKYESLRFETGTISSFLSEQSDKKHKQKSGKSDEVNVIIALHACDTATDDAIWSGISSEADIIVVAPCCHKEIRPQLNKHVKVCGKNHPLFDILRHNIYRERIAETVTDSLRALLLELAGYSVQVFEFIGGEHTSKNVMITGIRQQHRTDDEKKNANIRLRIRSLAALHGIQQQTLAQQMNEYLSKLDHHNGQNHSLFVSDTESKLLSDGTEKSTNGFIDTQIRPSGYRSMPPLPSGGAP